MENQYGMARVIEPGQVLPTSAWRLDNTREIYPNEIRIALEKIHIEGTSFRQICMESGDNDELIRSKIIDIVIRRGKLHNPVTDTGGLLYGTVEEIGSNYSNEKKLKTGDKVLYNASLASIPIYISRVKEIDRAYNQIEAEGYAIVHDKVPVVRKVPGVPVDLLLYTLNESGTLYRISSNAAGKKKILVAGNNLMLNLLFGHTIRKAAGPEASIISVLDKSINTVVRGEKIDQLVKRTFDEIHYLNILRPMECMETLKADGLFDMSVNCADIPGAETLNVLATRKGGTVFFANLINNYNIALYITESVARHMNIKCAEGYLEEYDEFDMELVKELAPYFKGATVSEHREKKRVNAVLNDAEQKRALAEDFISESRAMGLVLQEIMSVAKYDCNVLISGDTGVGKEKVANIIQKNSRRKMHPFVKVNCASISPNLMESEFFGYEPGSFTGASTGGKKGYFEVADNGMVFLDEIGELPPDIQAKLLRVIQDGEFLRVGGTRPIKTNVRIISATNRDLEELIEKHLFRRDLYYRLNVFPIKVPSLSERKEDIQPLISHFLKQYGEKFGISCGIDEDAAEYLEKCRWPGNIRELENVIQRLLINARGSNIKLMDVMKEVHGDLFESTKIELPGDLGSDKDHEGGGLRLDMLVGDFEKQIIRYACEKYGSTRKAAKAIGISQTQLVRKKNKYGI